MLDLQAELAEVAATLRATLAEDDLPADLAPPALHDGVLAYPERGGKALRPALLTWCCALYGDPARARFAAAAVEIFHTWTLVHDDIIDADDTRRGGPTVHAMARDRYAAEHPEHGPEIAAVQGRATAILAGDVQQGWAQRLLLRSAELGVRAEVVLALAKRLAGEVTAQLIRGEAEDVAFEARPVDELGVEEIEAMLGRKTGLLLRFAAEAGAAIGLDAEDFTAPGIRVLGDFAARAGLAFQLQDDLLGLYGDPDKLGKPVGSDLRQGKRTTLVAEALQRLDANERQRLLAGLGQPDLAAAEAQALAQGVRDCGAADAVAQRAAGLVASAMDRLAELPAGPPRERLRAWAEYICARHH